MNREEAQDIAQETFTKALERIDQFEGDKIEPWLYTIARNLFLDLRARKTEFLSDEPPEIEVLGHEEGVQISLDLQNCMEKMEDNDRALIAMLPFSSYEYIQEELGVSSANLRVKIFRVRNKLSECMDLAA
jgi:RNA polymerase sigma factor (sigma-70 family)